MPALLRIPIESSAFRLRRVVGYSSDVTPMEAVVAGNDDEPGLVPERANPPLPVMVSEPQVSSSIAMK